MPILLKLFGDLTKKVQEKSSNPGAPINLYIESEGIETVLDVLKKFNIDEFETSHIFVNGRYSGFKKKIKNGERVAIFPKKMGLLYKWYFKKEEDE